MARFSDMIWRLPPMLKSWLNIWSYFLSFAFLIFLFLSLFLSIAPLLPKYAPPNSSSSPEDYFSIRHVYSGILARLERNPLREEELKEKDPPSGRVWTSHYSLFFIFLNYASASLTLVTGGWPGSCPLWFEGSNCRSVVRKQQWKKVLQWCSQSTMQSAC